MRSILVACIFVLAGASTALAQGLRIVIDKDERYLWLMRGEEVVYSTPAAVGMNSGFSYGGRRWYFDTPVTGDKPRRVERKAAKPKWNAPDWFYYERASERGWKVRQLKAGEKVPLSDGTVMEVRGGKVGRTNSYGIFWEWPVGTEIVFDNTVFIPPYGSLQRAVPETLGPYALYMGDSYMIHGTHKHNSGSVGQAVSHGCVRVSNEAIEFLYKTVPVGTPIYIN